MSSGNKIGIIAEGTIDHVLLPPLLSRIAEDKAGLKWPVLMEDVAEFFPVRKRGHGGVLDAIHRLLEVLDTSFYEHAFFIILLDRRTQAVQTDVARLIRGKQRFVLGIAIEEIEAWWLGDRTNTLKWSGLSIKAVATCDYGVRSYHAERDRSPKTTLDELTRLSTRLTARYGDGNLDLASEFAEDFWRSNARLQEISTQCARGFGKFQQHVTQRFRAMRSARRR